LNQAAFVGALPESLKEAVAPTLMRLPLWVQRLIVGRPIRVDGLELHPTSQLAVKAEALFDVAPFSDLSVADARAQAGWLATLLCGPKLPLARVEELTLPGPAGEIPARLYADTPDHDAGGLLVYYHGGGHVIGTLDTHDSACRFIAKHAGVGVLSVDYRLAPEHIYPAAVDDSVAALAWASENAERLGFDAARIAVGGDSAGGNLAAVVALAAKTGEAPLPAFQLLIYPVCDYVERRPSYELFKEGFFLTEAEMDWYRDHYIPDRDAAHEWRVSPLRAPDHSGLPPTYILTAGFDPLRDEAEDYARILTAAGVPTALHRHDGLLHSFVNQTSLHRGARDAMLEACGALRLGLAPR
jgi:acetyl esterase/lipase